MTSLNKEKSLEPKEKNIYFLRISTKENDCRSVLNIKKEAPDF